MKKSILISLLSLTCFSLLAVACSEPSSPKDSVSGETHVVEFKSGTGFTYQKTESGNKLTIDKGESISFSLDIGAFYTGTPIVLANGTAVASSEGVYTLTVQEDTTITVEGIQKDVSNMLGTGAFDDAFVISRPIDLVYIAEQVNAGNETYAAAAYVLGGDIDCKGETLNVIGDMRTENAFFSGCVSCYTDPSTNEATRYTISNFKINASGAGYVGLFGCVQADLTTDGSGMFYGIRIENFEITASVKNMKTDPVLYCGGLIGYGMGATMYLCDAVNGEINVLADENYFSFAGGLIGCQQASYQQNLGQVFSSEIAYSTVDVDVNAIQGSVLYAGGIVGYAFTDSVVAPSFIHNAYATGNVSGAARAGGIAGGLGQYTSVSNCYTTGDVYANCTQSSALVTDKEYCYAFAGGLVGFAENDTSINDGFSAGSAVATAREGKAYAQANADVGGGYAAGKTSVNSQQYAAENCLGEITATTANTQAQTTLGWREHDWTFTDNAFPTINYAPAEGTVATVVTVKYVTGDKNVTIKVNGETQKQITYQDSYAPLVDAFNSGDLGIYLAADGNGYRSFGYFFDEACTKPVPYSYLTTSDKTLYVGFADHTKIIGNYELLTPSGKVALELTADGFALYQDGALPQKARYQFDGEELLLESVKFTKYYNGAIDSELSVNGDERFDMNRYQYANFSATLQNGALQLFDGVYFTKSAPLTAYKSGALPLLVGDYYVQKGSDVTYYTFRADGTATGVYNDIPTEYTYTLSNAQITLKVGSTTETLAQSELNSYDVFKGTWSKRASVGKTYVFDGMGGWTSYYGKTATASGTYAAGEQDDTAWTGFYSLRTSGTYTLNGDSKITLSSGETVTFTTDGFLSVSKNGVNETYYPENSHVGKWNAENGSVSLSLQGLKENGEGNATLTFAGGYVHELIYEPSEDGEYVCLYQLQTADDVTYKVVFGYFRYEKTGNVLSLTVYNPYDLETETGYTAHVLQVVDEYEGEWVSADELFQKLTFNGAGNYYDAFTASGKLTIGGETVDYKLNGNTLQGTFLYHDVEYTVLLDENTQQVKILSGANEITLERKDELSALSLIAFDKKTFTAGKKYAFDGYGNLAKGGKMTVDGTTYVYKKALNGYTLYEGETAIGAIALSQDGSHYQLTLHGNATALYTENALMGDWAISGAFALLQIGASDLNGNVLVRYENAISSMRMLDPSVYTFSCEIESMPRTFYVFLLGEQGKTHGLALSEYDSLAYRNYQICSRADAYFGTWTQENGNFALSFDGVHFDKNNRYANGTAHLMYKGKTTVYSYTVNPSGKVVLWSQELLLGSTVQYTLVPCELTDAGAYLNADKTQAFKRVQIDSLFEVVAKDATGASYVFNGGNVGETLGEVTSGEKTYTYKITAYDSAQSKATLELTDKQTNEVYTATLDYSNPNAQKITLVKQTDEQA